MNILNIPNLPKVTELPAAGDKGRIVVLSSNGHVFSDNGLSWDNISKRETSSIGARIDAGEAVITTGYKSSIIVPYDCVIDSVYVFSELQGSIEFDIIKDSYISFDPENSGSIVAASRPTLNNATRSLDTTLSGWTTTINAGDILGISVVSVSGIKKVVLSLEVTKT